MINLYKQERSQPSERLFNIDRVNVPVENKVRESGNYDTENSDAQQIDSDQKIANVVRQAIKDDQALAVVASYIRVTVNDGAITLEGRVFTEQQMNLAAGTAMAVGVVDKINNQLEITETK